MDHFFKVFIEFITILLLYFLYCFIFWFLGQGACGSKSPALKVKVPTPGPPGKPPEPTNISWASTVRRGEWRKWALTITELTNYRRRAKMKHSIQMFHLKKCHRKKLRSAEGQRGNEVRCCTFIPSGQRRKHLSKGLKEVRSKLHWAVVKDGLALRVMRCQGSCLSMVINVPPQWEMLSGGKLGVVPGTGRSMSNLRASHSVLLWT